MLNPINLTKKKLRDTYYGLPYIVRKKKYLVPPPPVPIQSAYVRWMKVRLQIAEKKEKETPMKLIWMRLTKYYQEMKDTDPEILDLIERTQQQRQQTLQRKMNYHEQYVKPFKRALTAPIFYFQKMSTTPQFSGCSFADARLKYSILSEDQKEEISQQCSRMNREHEEKYREIRQRHTIVQPKKLTGYHLFAKEETQKNNSILKDGVKGKQTAASKWKKLSQEQKAEYSRRAKIQNELQDKKYKEFLSRFRVTQKELEYYFLVSSRFDELKKSRRKKNEYFTSDHSESLQEEDETIDEQLLKQ